MSRINAIHHESAVGKSRDLLDAVKAKLGFAPNLMKTLANSAAVLEAYLNLNDTLGTVLDSKLREEIALVSAEENGCAYCASAHTALGKLAGLTVEETVSARKVSAANPRTLAALQFAQKVIRKHGKVTDNDVQAIRNAGFSDGEITEIIGHIALNIFTNYFNEVAETDIDFPKVELFS